jgi:hypothetical protein
VGLRPEQLYDLVEGVIEQRSVLVHDDRRRLLPELTMAEARRVIGILKRLERNQVRILAESRATPGRPSRHTDREIREAARRAAQHAIPMGAAPRPRSAVGS